MKRRWSDVFVVAAAVLAAVAGNAVASTGSMQGIITEAGEDSFTMTLIWDAMGPRGKNMRTFRWKDMWRGPVYHIDGETSDEAGCKAAAKPGARVIVQLSRGRPTYLNVMPEPNLPVVSTATSLKDGHLVLEMKDAVSISQWGRRGVTAETWPYAMCNLELHIDPATKSAFGLVTDSSAHAVRADASGLTLDDGVVRGPVTLTIYPGYAGEKQEIRTATLTLDATLTDGTVSGSWKNGEASGALEGRIEKAEPMGDDLLMWALCPRGFVPGQDGKRNTLVIPFTKGVAQQDGTQMLHYKGNFAVSEIDAVDVKIENGTITGTIGYSLKGNGGGSCTLTLDGHVMGQYVAVVCKVTTPDGVEAVADNVGGGRLWPVHPKVPALEPRKPKAPKKK